MKADDTDDLVILTNTSAQDKYLLDILEQQINVKAKKKKKTCVLINMVWFGGTSTIVDYLMPNHFYPYLFNIWLMFSNELELIFNTVKWFHLYLIKIDT